MVAPLLVIMKALPAFPKVSWSVISLKAFPSLIAWRTPITFPLFFMGTENITTTEPSTLLIIGSETPRSPARAALKYGLSLTLETEPSLAIALPFKSAIDIRICPARLASSVKRRSLSVGGISGLRMELLLARTSKEFHCKSMRAFTIITPSLASCSRDLFTSLTTDLEALL